MNCYDCALEGRAVTAVALCRHCGSGLCVHHLRAAEEPVRHTGGTGLIWGDRRARRFTCPTCHAAELPATAVHAS